MDEVPLYIPIIFLAVVITTFGFLLYAVKMASPAKKDFTPTVVATFVIILLFITALLSFSGFLAKTDAMPPRLPIILMLETVCLVALFFRKQARDFINRIPITTLTHIHIIRVPVEMVLWWLYKEQVIDPLLTFEGSNYDIIIGISAPFAGLFLVGMRSKSRFGAIVWNIAGIVLLVNIVYMATACSPYPFQSLCFEIPNTFVFEFPYVWLPTFVVPTVMFCHIASIYQLLISKDNTYN
ncbi:MAG: hypothetical protein AAFO69_07370 [Bacteroidota bacterium]